MNKDRIIGYIALIAMTAAFAVVSYLMVQKDKMNINPVFVQFDEMGSLQNEDVVMIRGLVVGKVLSIKRANNMALVEIKLDEPRIFREDTKFSNLNPNIMGSRCITIEPGTKGEIVSSSHVFTGKFEPGTAEILYLADVAREQVALLMKFIRLLQKGDENTLSIKDKIEEVLLDCESLVSLLGRVVGTVEKQTVKTLLTANDYATQIVNTSQIVNETLDSFRVQIETSVVKIDNTVIQIGIIINDLNNILTKFEKHPTTAFFIEQQGLVEDLNNLVGILQSFVKSVDKHGIIVYDENGNRKSMISFKNLHIMRDTARKKAKKRSEPLP